VDSGLLCRPQGAVPGGEKNCAAFGIGLSMTVVRQNEIVSSHEVKSRANLSRPVVVAAQWVNQHEIMLGFEAVQESILT
jgi:hypothetical protein